MIEAITAFLASIGLNPSHIFAGLAGAFTRTVVQGKKLTWEIVSGSIVGTLCAAYMTPIVASWLVALGFDLQSTNGIAFGIGLIGMSIAEGLVKLAQKWSQNPVIGDKFVDHLLDVDQTRTRKRRRNDDDISDVDS